MSSAQYSRTASRLKVRQKARKLVGPIPTTSWHTHTGRIARSEGRGHTHTDTHTIHTTHRAHCKV